MREASDFLTLRSQAFEAEADRHSTRQPDPAARPSAGGQMIDLPALEHARGTSARR